MTVRELIEALATMPADAHVELAVYGGLADSQYETLTVEESGADSVMIEIRG